MKISVFGLGYVGAVSAVCLAADGHAVVGVDTNPVKVDLLNQGRSPVIEAGLGELIREGVRAGRLRATTDCDEAVASTDLAFVCVGTPSQGNGSLDLGYLRRVCRGHRAGHRGARGRPSWWWCAARCCPARCAQVLLPDLERAAGRPVARSACTPSSCARARPSHDYHAPAQGRRRRPRRARSATWSPRWRRGRGRR